MNLTVFYLRGVITPKKFLQNIITATEAYMIIRVVSHF